MQPPPHMAPASSVWPYKRQLRLGAALTLYALWCRASSRAAASPEPWGPRGLAALMARSFASLLASAGVQTKTLRLPVTPLCSDERQYLVVWHPHGAYTTMALMVGADMSMRAEPLSWFPVVAPLLFSVPVLREALLMLNARSCDLRVFDALLASGVTVGVQPGGVPEQLQADHTREVAVFPHRLGFVRLAMKHGTPLLPVYIFGENQAYETHAAGRAMAALSRRWLGVPLVPVRGRWGLPWLMPKELDIHVVWGEPVPVGPPRAEPTDAEVAEVFDRYLQELRRIFDENKHRCLPPEVARHGLSVQMHRSGQLGKTAPFEGDAQPGEGLEPGGSQAHARDAEQYHSDASGQVPLQGQCERAGFSAPLLRSNL